MKRTPRYVYRGIFLSVAHTEAGKNWEGLFRADFLKENVENPGDPDPGEPAFLTPADPPAHRCPVMLCLMLELEL